ncbi:MAG: response regulator transcription factor [Flavobacteriales bacterium]|nr:response regulator transcription factor [Flavobacteriales bacterium]
MPFPMARRNNAKRWVMKCIRKFLTNIGMDHGSQWVGCPLIRSLTTTSRNQTLCKPPSPYRTCRPMAGSVEVRDTGYWRTVVIYAVAMAALVGVLKYFEYRFWIRDLSMEVYIGVVATLFTALGIWVGSKLLNREKIVLVEAPNERDDKALEAVGISARELEVLELMAKGNSNQEIADKLFISLATVKSHSSSLFVKLDVRRRTQAVEKARSLRIIG